MPASPRIVRRVVAVVYDQLAHLERERAESVVSRLRLIDEQVLVLQRHCRMYPICVQRSWDASARRLVQRVRQASANLSSELAALPRSIGAHAVNIPLPGYRQIAEELDQLEREFGAWTFEPSVQTLSVQTEPIELEDVYLGPFRIELQLNRLSEVDRFGPYHVIALDPNPAAGNRDVTHPHVSDDRLCEGDGYSAIRAALSGGRLADFFLTVAAILSNYNPTSPYVPLSKWEGETCTDCRSTILRDEQSSCRRCDEALCRDCVTYCHGCDEPYCAGCMETCAVCEEPGCTDCLMSCERCGTRCCSDCLDENATCTTCQETLSDESYEPEGADRGEASDAPDDAASTAAGAAAP